MTNHAENSGAPDSPAGDPTVPQDSRPPAAPPLPYELRDLIGALRSPNGMMQVVLSDKDRLAATLFSGRHPLALLACLLVGAVVFALPFGAIHDWRRAWVVVALYLGPIVVCLPALQVVGQYVGIKLAPSHYVAFGLSFAATAAMFSFGFFPIQWFLSATMHDEGSIIRAGDIGKLLLFVSFAAGVFTMYRILECAQRYRWLTSGIGLLIAWQALLAFICLRMAHTLGLS